MAGISLANYATSGSFDFYRQPSASAWQPDLPPQPSPLGSSDLAFASDRRVDPDMPGAEQALASLNP